MSDARFSAAEITARIELIVRSVLSLGPDVELAPDADLVSVVGLDSIEAFESVAALHEMMGVRIPEDINPKRISSIGGMADYVTTRYDASVVERFMTSDIEAKLASLRSNDDFE